MFVELFKGYKKHHIGMLVSSTLFISGCVSTSEEPFPIDASDQSFEVKPSVLASDSYTKETVKKKAPQKEKSKSFQAYNLNGLKTLVDVDIPSPNEIPTFASDKTVSVAVDEIGLVDFIHLVYGDLLNVDYVISPDVEKNREKVILNLQQPVQQSELFVISRNLLGERDIQVTSKDNIVYFSKKGKSKKSESAIGIGATLEDIPDVSGHIIQLIPYTYNSSSGIRKIAAKLSDATIFSYDEQKLMIVEGTRDEVMRVQRLVQMLDVPAIKGRDIRLLNLVYVQAGELKSLLTDILKEESIRVGSSGDTAMVAIPNQNSLIVYSSNHVIGQRVVDWARKLDKPAIGDKPQFYIFRPRYSKAEDINEALSNFMNDGGVSNNSGEPGSKTSGALANYKMTVSVDKVQNSLLINATPKDYHDLLNLLEKLDRLPGQIALDVTIAEVDLTDDFKAGITSLVADSSKNYKDAGTASIDPFAGTISLEGFSGAFNISLELLQSKTDVKVLSRPYLVVQDGQSASINSGKQVPVQTGETVTDGGNKTVEIQYRNTGINLSVTPTINADGIVALKVSQSVSNTADGPTDLNPIITNRSVSTQVMVGDGQTAILGGLVQENKSKGRNGVPFFSDIPLIGPVFKGNKESFTRSELVILITPQILRSTSDLDQFAESVNDVFSFPISIDGEPAQSIIK
ncbi:hypothetical protein DSB67_01150 [Vibrio campbellii]|uniref:type II secretion system protein GspD n=1 Tax=Vibrio campbellii TaxID=680 RepID=UPI00026C4ACB|nr:secretin N-terminal domain-containing protein [Vibrio campbellii]AXB30281.1 hypothetical protein DSB67_01150 [Vibrio campbellii]